MEPSGDCYERGKIAMTQFQINTMKKLEQSLVYSIRVLNAMTKPELTEIDRSRLAEEALDYIRSNMKGNGNG